ncbi:pseudouridine-5'-phosphatase-like [Lycorma delicatula]|uniref:pseudouridine-5'-phosphatase-like n=1 Tax=Lycorma delicatula TaxID=130591 RepID=UPI003F513E7C
MCSFNPVTHVIFDVDGTLIDTETIYTEIYQKMIEKYGKSNLPLEVRQKAMGRSEAESLEIIITELNIPATVEDAMKIKNEMEEEYLKNVTLMPGVKRLVCHLSKNNIPMAMASSSSYKSLELKFRKHQDFKKIFTHLLSGEDPKVKNPKPAPDIFLVCASMFCDKPEPKNCLVFEDSPAGVKAGISACMQVVMVPDCNTKKELTKEATLVLESLNNFKPELFGLPKFCV